MSVDVGSAVGYLDLDIQGFMAGLKTAQSEAAATTNSISGAIGSGLTTAGQKITSAGSALTKGITLPIAAVGTAVVKTSSTFEAQMSKVSAISGATGKDYDTLRAKAMEMGSKTKFSATEAGQAMEYMGMAGWKTGDMVDGLGGIMNLAAASGEDLGTTSDIVTDALTAFGLSAKDSTHFADVLAKTSTSANTNVSLLGETFKYCAPLCGAMGYSVEDASVAIGLMANSGIKGSQAGTSLKNMLVNLAKPTDAVANAMEKYNIVLTDSEGNMKPLNQLMTELRGTFSGLSEEQKAQLAATIAGKEGMSGLLAIMNASEKDYNSLSDAISNCDGTAENMANTMNDNLAGQFTILKSTLETIALQFGDILMPTIKEFVTKLQDLATWLTNLNDEQRQTVVKVALLLASLGPLLLAVGKLTIGMGQFFTTISKIPAAVGGMKTAMTAISTKLINVKEGFTLAKAGMSGFAAEASPLGAALAGITAPMIAIAAVIAILIAAFVHLWKTNEDFRNKVIGIWDGIKAKFESFAQGIVDRLNAVGFDFKNITEVISAVWDSFCKMLAPVFEGVFQQISNALSAAMDVITGILDVFIGLFTGNWDQCWTGIKEIFGAVWNFLVASLKNYADTIIGVANNILGWFGTSWNQLWTDIGNFFIDIWNGIVEFFTNVITGIITAVSNFITSIVTFFVELPNNIMSFLSNVITAIATWAVDMVNKAIEVGANFVNNIVTFFTQLPYKIGYFIGEVLGTVIKWAIEMPIKAKEMATNFINNIVTFFTQLPGKILTFITNAYNNVTTWASNMISKAIEVGTNFLANVVSFFTQLPGKILSFLTTAINNVISWVSNMGSQATSAGTTFINNVVTFISQLPGKIQTFLTQTITNLAKWVLDMGSKGLEAIKALINNVLEGAKDIPHQMLSVGKAIVDGVWQGIQDAKDQFVENVKNFFKGIVDGVKGALGIHSPSRVFRDEIGRFLPPGITDGFKAALPAAMAELNNALNKGIDSIKTNDIAVGTVDMFANTIKNVYDSVATYFETIETRISNSVSRMSNELQSLIKQGELMVNSDGSIGYIGYKGFGESGNGYKDDTSGKQEVQNSYQYTFYSNTKLSEIECAEEMKKAQKDIEEGFV